MKVIKKLENAARELARRNQTFRKFARGARTKVNTARFDAAKSGEIDDKLIYFTTFAGRSYGDSPKAIYEYMLSNENFRDYSYVWMLQHPEKYEYLTENANTTVVKQNSAAEMEAIAKAKYWITNYRMLDQYVPTDEQIYVQCWHGTPLKKLGYDLTATENAMNDLEEIRDKYRTDAERFMYLLSPGPVATERFISAWNLRAIGKESAIIEAGYPRNDRLIHSNPDEYLKVRKELGIADDKTAILYAPTWRDNQFDSGQGYTYTPELDFDIFLEHLGQNYVILFRAHYLVANAFDFDRYGDQILDVSGIDDINDLLIASDMLITDYSSIMFDYACLNRPMAFYMYDLDKYRDDIRGLYSGLEELPGPIIADVDSLVEAVREIERGSAGRTSNLEIPGEYAEKYAAFNKKYNTLNDGNATLRVIETIFRG